MSEEKKSELSAPRTDDHCVQCGCSPEAGEHVFDHDYVDPRLHRRPSQLARVAATGEASSMLLEDLPAELQQGISMLQAKLRSRHYVRFLGVLLRTWPKGK